MEDSCTHTYIHTTHFIIVIIIIIIIVSSSYFVLHTTKEEISLFFAYKKLGSRLEFSIAIQTLS